MIIYELVYKTETGEKKTWETKVEEYNNTEREIMSLLNNVIHSDRLSEIHEITEFNVFEEEDEITDIKDLKNDLKREIEKKEAYLSYLRDKGRCCSLDEEEIYDLYNLEDEIEELEIKLDEYESCEGI